MLPWASATVQRLSRSEKQILILTLDVITVVVAFTLTRFLQVLETGEPLSRALLAAETGALVLIAVAISFLLGLPRIQLKSYETRGMVKSASLGGALGVSAFAMTSVATQPLTPSGLFIFVSLFVLLSVALRLIGLHAVLAVYRFSDEAQKVIIYGAGNTGVQLALGLRGQSRLQHVAFIDDNRSLHGLSVAGRPVCAPHQLETLIASYGVSRVLLAMPSLSSVDRARIARRIADLGVSVQHLPTFVPMLERDRVSSALTDILPDAFLPREALEHTLAGAVSAYGGKSVMISGAGGSIGSELCRQLLKCQPRRLVLLDVSEAALYQIHDELEALNKPGSCEIIPMLGTVTDRRQVCAAFRAHEVEIVIHAAAYKHVPMVEGNVLAGIANNVLGTATFAQEARACGVERFVLVSTDKAVRPTSVMGATKRMAELVVARLARDPSDCRTLFTTVRFGNVLGTSGSVIPRFQQQIMRGGPVTLTHPDITRYFMTAQEATQLVLRAGAMARSGEVFVLDMGTPVRIIELARQMIRFHGYTVKDARNPDGDIEITLTELRPGEKLHEELSILNKLNPTVHPKIMTTGEVGLSSGEVAQALSALRRAVATGDTGDARRELMGWIARDLAILTRPEQPRAAARAMRQATAIVAGGLAARLEPPVPASESDESREPLEPLVSRHARR